MGDGEPEVNEHAKASGAMTLLHICGDTTPILSGMADTGAMIVEIDSKVSMAHAKKTIGDRVCLIGNLEPSAVLLQGSRSLVEERSRAVIADASLLRPCQKPQLGKPVLRGIATCTCLLNIAIKSEWLQLAARKSYRYPKE